MTDVDQEQKRPSLTLRTGTLGLNRPSEPGHRPFGARGIATLDITLYRDDLSTLGPKPVVQKTEMEIPITGKSVVLVDDVLYTGRTTRAASRMARSSQLHQHRGTGHVHQVTRIT